MTVEELLEELMYMDRELEVKVRVHYNSDTRSLTDDVRLDEKEGQVILHAI